MVELEFGILLVLIGAIFDVFDGAVARMLNAQSEFGKQIDSLADMVSFGVAPAYLLSQIIEVPYNYLAVFIVLGAGIRLAKFNISGGETYWFSGMPSPASALFVLSLCIASFGGHKITILWMILIVIIISLLNVSSIKMFSFKGIKKDRFTSIFLVITFLVTLMYSFIDKYLALLIGMVTYTILSISYNFLVKDSQ